MKSKKITEVEAYIYGEKIGTLILHEGEIYFSYEEKFKTKNIQISPLKLHTETTAEVYTNNDSDIYQGMPSIFFDSLPDKFGMTFIDRYFESKGYRTHDITLLDRLSFMGDRGMGAIEYKPKEDSSTLEHSSHVLVAKEGSF